MMKMCALDGYFAVKSGLMRQVRKKEHNIFLDILFGGKEGFVSLKALLFTWENQSNIHHGLRIL